MPVAAQETRWKLRRPAPARRRELAEKIRVTQVTAQLLINRGVEDATGAALFLEAPFSSVHPPELLPDMAPAVGRLVDAVRGRQRVLVYGDADADGLAATAIMVRLLRSLGCAVSFFIPARISDGYGLTPETVERVIATGPQLVLTVDCGITSHREVARLRSAGIDVIVTDHHEPRADLPEALAVVAPRRPGSAYPFPDLCGAAVAFKLAWALAQELSPGRRVSQECREFLNDAAALAAIGTVADVCPLVGENRALVRHGLRALAATRLAGLALLAAEATRRRFPGSHRGKILSARDVAFGLAPVINAAGRLGRPETALAMLLADDPVEAGRLSLELVRLNEERRALGRQVFAAVSAAAELEGDAPALVLASDDWHAGVVGLAASKLVERFGRPAAVVAFDGPTGRGSARGPRGGRLHESLGACREHLEACGGHDGAAGFTVRRERFEGFKAAFLGEIERRSRGAVPAEKAGLDIEAEVPAGSLTAGLSQELESLGPFGEGNPEPLLASLALQVAGTPQAIGSGRTASLRVRTEGGSVRAVGFGWAPHLAELSELGRAGRLDLAYRLRCNERTGEPELILEAFRARP